MDLILFFLLFYYIFSFIVTYVYSFCMLYNNNEIVIAYIMYFIISIAVAPILLPILIGMKLYNNR